MLFSQTEFFVFFVFVLVSLIAVGNRNTLRKTILLAASFYFYAYWDWRFLGLIILSTAIDFTVGLLLEKYKGRAARKLLLACSVTANLGILGFFKYFNFFVESAASMLSPLGIHVGTLSIVLPVGISFYTFQTMSYTIDLYRGRIQVTRSLLDFALFVAFFPQLVAGPIVRASDFLPQLKSATLMEPINWWLGTQQFIRGLFKKVIIADRVAPFVDTVFAHAGAFDASTTWLAVAAYSIQIYCDFSGYSDMAIGLAKIMGFEFPENFNHPYISTSLDEFWRRWHISLSSWLRDYLYIPLGGNRLGRWKTYRNLMLTMLLGGLWHGANWTFVFWGLMHGVGLALVKCIREENKGIGTSRQGPAREAVQKTAGWIVTMFWVLLAWVFFRSPDFATAVRMLQAMFFNDGTVCWFFGFAFAAVGSVALWHLAVAKGFVDIMRTRTRPQTLFVLEAAGAGFLLWITVVFFPQGFTPFIYFQF